MNFWRAPKLPISVEERVWIDSALDRLIALFGEEAFQNVVVQLPKEELFPEWDGTEACVPPLVARICGYMRADPSGLNIEILPDRKDRLHRSLPLIATDKSQGAAGTYRVHPEEGTTISVKESLLGDPIALIATLAHEISHVRLLGEGHIERNEENMEPLTDLCTVFWGLGIFTANSAFRFAQSNRGWSVKRQGYLSEEMWGYALAAWAYRRGDREAKWSRHLATNVKAYFTASRNHLLKNSRSA